MTTQVYRADVMRFVGAVVRRNEALFEHFPDIGRDDLKSEIYQKCMEALPSFNPAKASLSTFISRVAHFRLLDIKRSRTRKAEHERVYAVATLTREQRIRANEIHTPEEYIPEPEDVVEPPKPGPETVEGEIVGSSDTQTLAEWLLQAYVYARRMCARASRQGRTYEAAQAVAVAGLARKLKLSVRGTHGLFEDREDLRRVLGFRNLPSRAWFGRALGEVETLSAKLKKAG